MPQPAPPTPTPSPLAWPAPAPAPAPAPGRGRAAGPPGAPADPRRELLDGVRHPAVLLDAGGRVVLANRAWEDAATELPQAAPGEDHLEAVRAAARTVPGLAALADGLAATLVGERETFALEYERGGPRGRRCYEAQCTAMTGGTGVLVSHVDVTARRDAMTALAEAAARDALTGLANRAVLLERLAAALHGPSVPGLLFLDLDDFKRVNDSLGHGAGDELLMQVAERLRAVAAPPHLVARLGGDEFVVLCEDVGRPGALAGVATRVHAALSDPYRLSGHARHVGVSVGCRLADDPRLDAEAVLREADIALYHAKGEGKGRVVAYAAALGGHLARRHDVAAELRAALAADGVELHYQPQVDLRAERLVGVEAFPGLRSPRLGFVAHGELRAVAGERGLGAALGQWTLRVACAQLAAWRARPGLEHVTLTVDASAADVRDHGFAAATAAVLAELGLPGGALCVELPHTALHGHGEALGAALEGLRELGVYVCVEGLGAGRSSLAVLGALPVEMLKVDGSFVDGLGTERSDSAIVASVVGLAHAMGLHVVADGVDTPLQASELAALGCTVGQGRLFAGPGPAADLGAWEDRPGAVPRPAACHRGQPSLIQEMMHQIGIALETGT